uniref:Uncharacterized protein n=1 Tax=Favella ehrenbergii TaxID=182087 RepID=A0A7S3MK97_9SPIT|mmetsp:Transcript_15936/g.20129  ORF Transcript_15936/g.20129 Transcript_15936/m.20129 type:complete len:179 (+) Transcript_15936:509-1045(+)
MLNFYVWEWGVLFGYGILNAVYGIFSWLSYDAAFKQLDKKTKTLDSKNATATALQADIMREWNSYAIEDIVSTMMTAPLIPYWYTAMGMCEEDDPHFNCPEDWQEDKLEWFREDEDERRGQHHPKEDDSDEEGEGSDDEEDYEIWEKEQDIDSDDLDEKQVDDEVVDEPIDPFALIAM